MNMNSKFEIRNSEFENPHPPEEQDARYEMRDPPPARMPDAGFQIPDPPPALWGYEIHRPPVPGSVHVGARLTRAVARRLPDLPASLIRHRSAHNRSAHKERA